MSSALGRLAGFELIDIVDGFALTGDSLPEDIECADFFGLGEQVWKLSEDFS